MLQSNPETFGVVCKLCGGRKFRLRHEWDIGDYWNQTSAPLAVWDCVGCSLVMLYPVPAMGQQQPSVSMPAPTQKIPELPAQGDWHSPLRRSLARQYWWKPFRARVKDALIGTRSDRFLRGCVRLKSSGQLLDIGAGTGDFLTRASRYYECFGVEPSPIGAAACRAKGFHVYESNFEDIELPDEHFDMITMDSVIEHVTDPLAVLAKCRRLLKPGGCVGMVTPNIAGPSYQWHRAGWNGFRHGWHTFLFSGKTLKGCIRKARFEVVRWPQRNLPLLDDGLLLWGRKPYGQGVRNGTVPAA